VSALEVRDLSKNFAIGGAIRRQRVHAVEDVSFSLQPGRITALVGESGSGKSTVARLLARVYPPTRGDVYFRGRPLRSLRSRRDLLWYRGEVALVLQDPFSAFNPVFRVSHGVMRNLALHRPDLNRRDRRREAERVCESVELSPRMLRRFPY
jgi:peptide/nickel transport system ATP-binding protein